MRPTIYAISGPSSTAGSYPHALSHLLSCCPNSISMWCGNGDIMRMNLLLNPASCASHVDMVHMIVLMTFQLYDSIAYVIVLSDTNDIQLLAMDILVLATMKNAAKCDM